MNPEVTSHEPSSGNHAEAKRDKQAIRVFGWALRKEVYDKASDAGFRSQHSACRRAAVDVWDVRSICLQDVKIWWRAVVSRTFMYNIRARDLGLPSTSGCRDSY